MRHISLHECMYVCACVCMYVNNISKTANQTLGFLKRNIKVHKQDLKSTAYKTLCTPTGYASTVLSPHTAADIQKIESVQSRATRLATRDYRSSV